MAFADFEEAFEVCAVTAMEDAFAGGFDDVAAIVPMGIVDVAGAPMMAGGVDDFQAVDFEPVPDFHFMDG